MPSAPQTTLSHDISNQRWELHGAQAHVTAADPGAVGIPASWPAETGTGSRPDPARSSADPTWPAALRALAWGQCGTQPPSAAMEPWATCLPAPASAVCQEYRGTIYSANALPTPRRAAITRIQGTSGGNNAGIAGLYRDTMVSSIAALAIRPRHSRDIRRSAMAEVPVWSCGPQPAAGPASATPMRMSRPPT
jgi:hypothetical protein